MIYLNTKNCIIIKQFRADLLASRVPNTPPTKSTQRVLSLSTYDNKY